MNDLTEHEALTIARKINLALATLALCAFVALLALISRKLWPVPVWDGVQWTCPAPYSVYASESELREGRETWVHCVK
jgi:hypothetical protein